MNSSTAFIASALVAAVSIASAAAQTGPAPVPTYKSEKCFGIAKMGKNDCQTAASSCAGTSKKDAQGDAWVYVAAGTCNKIVGASNTPKKG